MSDVDRRRAEVADRWALDGGVVLVEAGSLVPVPGSDTYHPFHPHPDFAYLTEVGSPDAVLAFDAAAATWQVFSRRLSADELVWEPPPTAHGLSLDELDGWLAARGADRSAVRRASDPTLAAAIADVRVRKDASELDDLRRAAACSLVGFDWVYANTRPGMTERDVQIGMEAGFFSAGAPRVAYDSIVASGPNGSFLHYAHGLDDVHRPASRTIEAGDLLLIDAGALYGGYASDVTRTMVVGAEPTDEQRFVWELVLRTQELAIDRCRPGVEWREVHLEAARTIGEGLVEFGLLRGRVDDLVGDGAVALFFPHGLGHLIGLTVHDVAGYPGDRERSSHPQLRYLRTDRPLEAGMITSVEPGVYFIDALLADPVVRDRHRDDVVWERVDELRGFGGIRIEDDIHVTTGDPEVLSAAIAKPIRIG